LREREALLRRTRKREHILGKIISSIRDMTTPTDMLDHALAATMEGIPSDGGCIIQKTPHAGGSFKAEVKQQTGISTEADLLHSLCQKALAFWSHTQSGTPPQEYSAIVPLQIGTRKILMGITSHHGVDNGAIFLIRAKNSASAPDWHEDEIHMFKGITTHLGIALEQVITFEELEKRAFTDELTNLLNRRAFTQEVKKRLHSQKRSRRAGAMLYLDLDNFKNVNDSKGHALGDTILKQLARLIGDNIRVGDYAARLGGDEFAVWLDEVTEQDAHAKARSFIAAGNQLARLADVTGPQLSLSIGMAIRHPDDDLTFDKLMDNTDKALYQAKLSGKATYALYDPNKKNIEHEKGNHA
ncbi:MAG: GGDEF domain-containing protein, partial [Emcibacter sp.]|nr:GGDEF domain-containing protein [Emcibacter sp.]